MEPRAKKQKNQHVERPRGVKQHDDFDGFVCMSCTMPERDWYEVGLDIGTGAGSGSASYDKPETLDFILDAKPLKRKGIHSTV